MYEPLSCEEARQSEGDFLHLEELQFLISGNNARPEDIFQDWQSEGIAFMPLMPAETLGDWHPRAEEQIRELVRALARCILYMEGGGGG